MTHLGPNSWCNLNQSIGHMFTDYETPHLDYIQSPQFQQWSSREKGVFGPCFYPLLQEGFNSLVRILSCFCRISMSFAAPGNTHGSRFHGMLQFGDITRLRVFFSASPMCCDTGSCLHVLITLCDVCFLRKTFDVSTK